MSGLGEKRTLHAMSIDDAYQVKQVLAQGAGGLTELVTIDDSGPYLRKRIPLPFANRKVWAALAECSCPRLPRVVATYEMPDQFVIICDYIPGDTLAQVVAARGKLAPREAVETIQEVCEAASDLHAHGIVHCDISPENIVVAADGIHLVDLGIARISGQTAADGNTPLGTWGFAAPEQFGFAPVDERTDVYAIACLLGYLLTGLRPDDGSYQTALADERTVAAPLRGVIERGSTFEPSARFASAQALAEAAANAIGTNATTDNGTPGSRGSAGGTISDIDSTPSISDASKPESENPHTEAPTKHKTAKADRRERNEREETDADEAHKRPARKRRKAVAIGVCLAIVVVACTVFIGAALQSEVLGSAPFHASDPSTDTSATTPSNVNASESSDSGTRESAPAEAGGTTSTQNAKDAAPDDAKDADAVDEADTILSIVESNWSVNDSGYIQYIVGLRNNSQDKAVIYPTLAIVGRDANGEVLSTDDQVFEIIQPEQTIYFGFDAGNGTVPSSVDFVLEKPRSNDIVPGQNDWANLCATDVRAVSNGFGGTDFVGEMTLKSGNYTNETADLTAITIVLRDEAGNAIFGTTGFASCPQQGEQIPFEVAGGHVPPYSSFDVYIQEW